MQRADDMPETVLSRLETYAQKTQPLVDYYAASAILINVDNESGLDLAMRQIQDQFAQRGLISSQ